MPNEIDNKLNTKDQSDDIEICFSSNIQNKIEYFYLIQLSTDNLRILNLKYNENIECNQAITKYKCVAFVSYSCIYFVI